MIQRAIKFGITGLLVSAIHVFVATGLIHFFALHPALANSIAFLVAAAVSLYVNTYWSFSSSLSLAVAKKYFLVSVVGLMVSAGLSNLVYQVGLGYMWGIAAVLCVMPLVNFLFHYFWTYRRAI